MSEGVDYESVIQKLTRDYASKSMECELNRRRAERLRVLAVDCVSVFHPQSEILVTAERHEAWEDALEKDLRERERIERVYGH